MKVNVSVAYKVKQGDGWYSFERKMYEVEPFKITRYSCGRHGAARNRYYYQAHFVGFGDMLDVHRNSLSGKETYESINRQLNKSFNPKKLNWDGDVAIIKEETTNE